MPDQEARSAAYPKRTMQDDLDRLREAWLDFAFQVLKALGIVAFVQRLGWKLKPWAREREARDDR